MGGCAKWVLLLALAALLTACGAKDEQPVPLDAEDVEQVEQVYQQGRAAYLAERYEDAAEHFARVATADPEHVKARINWGASLSRGGRAAGSPGPFSAGPGTGAGQRRRPLQLGAPPWPASAAMRKRWRNSTAPAAWAVLSCRQACNGRSTGIWTATGGRNRRPTADDRKRFGQHSSAKDIDLKQSTS